MLGVDRRAAGIVWTVFLIAFAIGLLWLARSTVALFAFALLFAYLLAPVLRLVNRFTPARVPAEVSLGLLYLLLIGLLVFAGITLGSRIAEEAASLAARLPNLVQDPQWQNRIPLPVWLEPQRGRLLDFLRAEARQSGRDVVPYLQRLGAQLALGVRYAGYLVLIPVLSFFFLKDGARMRDRLVLQLGAGPARNAVEEILFDIDRLLGQYMRALVLQALSAFGWYAIFLAATGAPYGMLLSSLAGPLEFIPFVGPLAAGLITALITGIAGYGHVGWFVLFWFVLRGFQDYVLVPFLLGAGIEMDPLLVLFGVLAGEQVAGIAGMFLSVPVIAIFSAILGRLRHPTAPTPAVRPAPDSVE